MDAVAKRDMAGRPAANLEFFRLVPAARIAIGGGKEQQDFFVLRDFDSLDIDGARGGAEESLHRRFPSEHFIEGDLEQRFVVEQRLPLLGKSCEGENRRAEPVHRRVEPGGEQGTDKNMRLALLDFAAVVGGPDRRTEPLRSKLFARATLIDPFEHRLGGRFRFAEQRIARTERVEQHVAVRQQVLASIRPQAHCVREDLQGVGFGEIGDCIEAALGDEPVGEFGSLGAECLSQSAQGRGRENSVHYHPRAGMQGRVDLEKQALRPPGPDLAEIVDADTGAGGEGLPIGERGEDLLVPRHRPDAIALETHDRSRLAQLMMVGIRVFQELVGKGVDIRNGMAGFGREHGLVSELDCRASQSSC